MSIDKISIPKNVSISLIIAKVENINTRPVKALVILALALSTCALSPPDRIQLTAPQISINKKATTPNTINKPIIFGNIADNRIEASGASNRF